MVERTVTYTRALRAAEQVRVAIVRVRPAEFHGYSGQDRQLWVLVESTLEPNDAIMDLAGGWRVISVRWLDRGQQHQAAEGRTLTMEGAA